ncbi:MAG: hypothetical protein ACOX0R_02075 [Candidatus Dojkabacteria bacterium]|jgi:hypothetical protein
MKKNILVIVIVVALFFLSACADAPGIEDSSLPENFYVLKAKESGEVEYPPTEEFIVTTPSPIYPSGNYILLKNVYGTNLFRLSFVLNDEEICHWEEQTSHPYSFAEKGTIYISEQNCSGMGDSVVSWDLSQEKASLNGEDVQIWTLTGSKFFKN